jgi:hypothetical protein
MIALSQVGWAELRDDYNIAMPETRYVIGWEPAEHLGQSYIPHRPWQHKTGYYMIAEEVIGRTLEEELALGDPRVVREVDAYLSQLAAYLLEKLDCGGFFAADIGLMQCMYGHTATDPVRRIYHVDLEPMFSNRLDNDRQSHRLDSLVGAAYYLAGMVETAEHICGQQLERGRSATLQLLASFPLGLHGALRVSSAQQSLMRRRTS